MVTRAMLLRRGLLLLVAAAMLTGVFAGLARLGVVVAWGPRFAVSHGALLVLGAFATVIGLERAVALGSPWGLVAPALGASGAISTLTGFGPAPSLLALGAVALVPLNLAIVRRQPAVFTCLMALGSAVLAFGAVQWVRGTPPFDVAPAWQVFFVLTIVAERLELSRLAPTPRWAPALLGATCLLAAALGCARALGVDTGRALGASFVLIGAWQLRFDLARRVVQRGGLPRFTASAVLAGATWLVVCGVLLALPAQWCGGWCADAVLHAVFVGYVLSMVFGHAPIILPAVAQLEVPFTRWLFLPLAVLHGGLVARVVGDLGGWLAVRQVAAAANAAALLTFVVVVVVSRARRAR